MSGAHKLLMSQTKYKNYFTTSKDNNLLTTIQLYS